MLPYWETFIRKEPRPDWDPYFLGIADAVSKRGDCTRSKVGCVLVDTDRTVIATGYNGVAPGVSGCLEGACPRGRLDYKDLPRSVPYDLAKAPCIATHAEENAVRTAQRRGQALRLVNATAYVTRDVCSGCQKQLAQVGVQRVVFPGDELYL